MNLPLLVYQARLTSSLAWRVKGSTTHKSGDLRNMLEGGIQLELVNGNAYMWPLQHDGLR